MLPDGAWRPGGVARVLPDRLGSQGAIGAGPGAAAAGRGGGGDAAPDSAPTDRIEPSSALREERRPAELEWLPRPTSFDVVRPEDERAQAGQRTCAHAAQRHRRA